MSEPEPALFHEVTVDLKDLASAELALAKARAHDVGVVLLVGIAFSSAAFVAGTLSLGVLGAFSALALGADPTAAVAVAGLTLLLLAGAFGLFLLSWLPSRVKNVLPRAQVTDDGAESA